MGKFFSSSCGFATRGGKSCPYFSTLRDQVSHFVKDEEKIVSSEAKSKELKTEVIKLKKNKSKLEKKITEIETKYEEKISKIKNEHEDKITDIETKYEKKLKSISFVVHTSIESTIVSIFQCFDDLVNEVCIFCAKTETGLVLIKNTLAKQRNMKELQKLIRVQIANC